MRFLTQGEQHILQDIPLPQGMMRALKGAIMGLGQMFNTVKVDTFVDTHVPRSGLDKIMFVKPSSAQGSPNLMAARVVELFLTFYEDSKFFQGSGKRLLII